MRFPLSLIVRSGRTIPSRSW